MMKHMFPKALDLFNLLTESQIGLTYNENKSSTLDIYIFRISYLHNITYIMHPMPLCMSDLFLNILGKLKNLITY